jgi:hypothetical protein
VGEGGAKIVGAVPVRIPRKTVVGAVKRKTKLAGGMKGVGDVVARKTVQTRPGREGRIGASRTHNVKVDVVLKNVERKWPAKVEIESKLSQKSHFLPESGR